jgi:hypothetical protein
VAGAIGRSNARNARPIFSAQRATNGIGLV